MKIDKRYLKRLYEDQIEIERKIKKLKSQKDFMACKECSFDTSVTRDAELRGLMVADTAIDSAINNYLHFHG